MRKLKKRALSILLAAVMVVTMLPAVSLTAFAAGEGLPISEENFPDANFRSYVSSEFDGDKDGTLSDEEISAVTNIFISSYRGIESFVGIEYFKNLTRLTCISNQLTTLDVSNNPKLSYLECYGNNLKTLDVSNNPELTFLSCWNNNLTMLDVSNNPKLTELKCNINKLTTLDASNNPELTKLYCYNNNLTTLNVSNNLKLKYLECYKNNLTTLDVSNNPKLTSLYCDYNKLTTLDVSNNPELTGLHCDNNNLATLDLSEEIKTLTCNAQTVDCEFIKVDGGYSVDIAKLVGDENREKVSLSDNAWSYDSAKGTATYLGSGLPIPLSYVYFGENLKSAGMDVTLYSDAKTPINEETFPDANFRSYVSREFDGDKDGVLSIREISTVTQISLSYKGIESLAGIECFENLTSLYCNNNNIAMLDLSEEIKTLTCNAQTIDCEFIKGDGGYSVDIAKLVGDDNKEKVSISDNAWSYDSAKGIATYLGSSSPISLSYVYFGENLGAAGMDVTLYSDAKTPINEETFPDVKFRSYVSNYLDGDKDGVLSTREISAVTKIELSNRIESFAGIEYFKDLTYLSCAGNNLTTLDVSNNPKLTSLKCYNNKLTTLDASNNPELTELYCYNNKLTTLDVSNNPNLTDLYCYDNNLTTLDVSNNTELTSLKCYNNNLTTLDVSNNPKLTELYCYNNKLTTLDVSNNPNLTDLYCYDNNLTTLDVSNNTELTSLKCYNNNLTTLDVSNNPKLTELRCNNNNLTSLDLSKEIETLICDPQTINVEFIKGDGGYSVDIAKLVGDENREKVSLSDTAWSYDSAKGIATYLGGLPISLSYVYFGENLGAAGMNVKLYYDTKTPINEETFPDANFRSYISSQFDGDKDGALSIREISTVTQIRLSYKGIESLAGIECFENLTSLYCNNNNLTTLDVSNNTELSYLDCSYNNLTSLDLSKEIESLRYDNQTIDGELIKGDGGYSVDIAKLVGDVNREKVSFSGNAWSYDSAKGIATYLGSGLPMTMTYVYYGANLKSDGMNVTLHFDIKIPINEENFPDVNFRSYVSSRFDGDKDGALSAEEISAVTEIDFYGYDKQIETLTGIEKFVELNVLNCGNNKLTTLDVSQNINLFQLYCSDNQLTSLDISQNPNIYFLDCSSNQLSTLIIGKKESLMWLCCSDNLLTTLDLSECSARFEELYCDNNLLTSLYLYGDVKPAAASENINRPMPRDEYHDNTFNGENNRFTALDLSKKFDEKYCSGQTFEAEMVKTSDGYAVDLGKLVGGANKAKVTVPDNWSYDSETGIAACTGAVAPETLKYNYFGLNLPTSGMDVTLTLTVKGGGEIEPDKDKILVMKKEQIKAYVDGQILPMTDYGNGNFAMAKSVNGTYALPLRCIGEAFDMRVDYLGNGRTKITNAAGEYVVVTRDSNILEKYDADNNLINSFTADFATFTDEAGITYAPMRAVSEALGLGVSYVGSGTTGHGSYVAVSTDLFLNLKPDYVLAEIEKAYALGL